MRTARGTRRTATALCLAVVLTALGFLTSLPAAQATSTATANSACSAFLGAKTLGAYYRDANVKVYACGARPSFDGSKSGGGPTVRPFAGSSIYYEGYQCVELVARFLKAKYGADPVQANGAQAVDRYAAAYPTKFRTIANGTKSNAPRKGDVLSLSANKHFNDVGHTGVVISSSVDSSGNGTIKTMEENWGGAGGAKGYHNYTVRGWRVIFAGLPHIKWLRSR